MTLEEMNTAHSAAVTRMQEMREEKNNFEMENQHMAADSAMQMSNYNAQMSRMVSAVSSSRHCG